MDRELAELLDYIDSQLGKKNVLIFLTADHGVSQIPAYLQELRIPAGYIKESQIADSLNTYLNTLYGIKPVLKLINQQVYLDHASVESRNLSLTDVQEKAVLFLKKFSKVEDVVSAGKIRNDVYFEGPRLLMQRGFNTKRSGDVLINYLPGYGNFYSQATTHGSPYSYDTHVPLLFYGWNIRAGNTSEPVAVQDIAATLAVLLNIQFPSGCTGKPILSIEKNK